MRHSRKMRFGVWILAWAVLVPIAVAPPVLASDVSTSEIATGTASTEERTVVAKTGPGRSGKTGTSYATGTGERRLLAMTWVRVSDWMRGTIDRIVGAFRRIGDSIESIAAGSRP